MKKNLSASVLLAAGLLPSSLLAAGGDSRFSDEPIPSATEDELPDLTPPLFELGDVFLRPGNIKPGFNERHFCANFAKKFIDGGEQFICIHLMQSLVHVLDIFRTAELLLGIPYLSVMILVLFFESLPFLFAVRAHF